MIMMKQTSPRARNKEVLMSFLFIKVQFQSLWLRFTVILTHHVQYPACIHILSPDDGVCVCWEWSVFNIKNDDIASRL